MYQYLWPFGCGRKRNTLHEQTMFTQNSWQSLTNRVCTDHGGYVLLQLLYYIYLFIWYYIYGHNICDILGCYDLSSVKNTPSYIH